MLKRRNVKYNFLLIESEMFGILSHHWNLNKSEELIKKHILSENNPPPVEEKKRKHHNFMTDGLTAKSWRKPKQYLFVVILILTQRGFPSRTQRITALIVREDWCSSIREEIQFIDSLQRLLRQKWRICTVSTVTTCERRVTTRRQKITWKCQLVTTRAW